MFTHRIDQPSDRKASLNWLLLGFNGGFINAGGFLVTGRFVTHVTGFATLFGVDSVQHGWDEALGILSVPLFFLGGSFLAGWLIDRRAFRGEAPHYDYVMALCAGALLVAAFATSFTHFVPFGETLRVKEVYLVLAALCLASGLQNAALTSSSGNSVRTTHLTGITTDLGLGLARLLSLGSRDERAARERHANRLRAGTILAFIAGSAVGAWVFFHTRYVGFLIPAFIAATAAWQGRRTKLRLRAALGASPSREDA